MCVYILFTSPAFPLPCVSRLIIFFNTYVVYKFTIPKFGQYSNIIKSSSIKQLASKLMPMIELQIKHSKLPTSNHRYIKRGSRTVQMIA